MREECLRIASQMEAFQERHREPPPKPETKKEPPLIPHMECLPPETQARITNLLPQLAGEERQAFIRNMTTEAKRRHRQVVSQERQAIEASLEPQKPQKPQKPPSLFDKIRGVFN